MTGAVDERLLYFILEALAPVGSYSDIVQCPRSVKKLAKLAPGPSYLGATA